MKCSVCGKEELLPFKCRYCGEYFCPEHRLPEKHGCLGAFAAASPYEKEMREVKIKIDQELARSVPRRRSLTEAKHITVSMILVSLVGISLISDGYQAFGHLLYHSPHILALYLAGFILSYLVHEMAHRIVARRNNVRAYFKLDPLGSLLTLFSAIPFLPIKFISPGAVVLAASTSPRVTGLVAFWGPASNLVLSTLFYLSSFILKAFMLPPPIHAILMVLSKFNAFIAFFNLIPFGPLDGLKVMRWSPYTWAVAFALSLLMLAFTW